VRIIDFRWAGFGDGLRIDKYGKVCAERIGFNRCHGQGNQHQWQWLENACVSKGELGQMNDSLYNSDKGLSRICLRSGLLQTGQSSIHQAHIL